MTETTTPALYRVAPGVETRAFDAGSRAETPSYLVEVDASSRYEVTAGVHRVIELVREEPRSAKELVERLREEGSSSATEERLAWLIGSVLLPRGILQQVSGDGAGEVGAGSPSPRSERSGPAEPERTYRPVRKRSSYLWVKVPLFGAEAVRPLTRVLALPFLVRGALAMPVGLHLGWNVAIGPLLGLPVSGAAPPVALLAAEGRGPERWLGDAFGPEGGLGVTAAVLVLAILVVAWLRLRHPGSGPCLELADYRPRTGAPR